MKRGSYQMGKNDSLRALELSAESKRIKALLDRHERALKRMGAIKCPLCGGGGTESTETMARYGDKPYQCSRCNGKGWVMKQ